MPGQRSIRRTRTAPAASTGRRPFHFTLRSLFLLLAGAGILCAAVRSLVRNDTTIFLGIGAFCYGGIVAIPCYAFVGSLMVLTTTTTRGQRAGELFAAAVAAAAWMAFIVVALARWPQLCIAYSIVVVAIIAWLVRINWAIEEGPSPENMLQRLRQAKKSCPHKLSHDDKGT